MIAAMLMASTCQHGCISEVALILGDREGFPESVLRGNQKDLWNKLGQMQGSRCKGYLKGES